MRMAVQERTVKTRAEIITGATEFGRVYVVQNENTEECPY